MGNVTRNLSRIESACKCGCGLMDPHPMLVAGIQAVCDDLQDLLRMPVRVNVTGPCRCAKHNAELRAAAIANGTDGPAAHSYHMPAENTGYCDAHDCVFECERTEGKWERIGVLAVYESAQKVERFAAGGIGLYLETDRGPRVHLDVRTTAPARWALINGKKSTLPAVLEAASKWSRDQSRSRNTPNLED